MRIVRSAQIVVLVVLSLVIMSCGRRYNNPSASSEAMTPQGTPTLAAPAAT